MAPCSKRRMSCWRMWCLQGQHENLGETTSRFVLSIAERMKLILVCYSLYHLGGEAIQHYCGGRRNLCYNWDSPAFKKFFILTAGLTKSLHWQGWAQTWNHSDNHTTNYAVGRSPISGHPEVAKDRNKDLGQSLPYRTVSVVIMTHWKPEL